MPQVKRIINLIKKLLRQKKQRKATVPTHYTIPRTQHHVSKTDISHNALKVLNRIQSGGYDAYLVGGSVRDLLLRKAPKDFDVATNATPNQVRNLFRNARIIGRRFKLVHILFHREIIEVATFRAQEPVHHDHQTNERGMVIRDNVFGTLEDDAWRRDFTINSLYYEPSESTIIDFTGGFQDIQNRQIRIIGNPTVRYQEDPVRMLRAIRFSAKLKFDIAADTAAPIATLNELIAHVPSSRLFDEMIKLYQCGAAETVHRLMVQFQLFAPLFPQTAQLMQSTYPVNAFLVMALESTDSRIKEDKPVTPAFLFAVLLWFPILEQAKQLRANGMDPLPALEKAMSLVLEQQNKIISIPKRLTQVMREIWLLQFRFDKRTGTRAFHLLTHGRFRAAYDFLALRALAGDASLELVQWWTQFQESDPKEQARMVDAIKPASKNKS